MAPELLLVFKKHRVTVMVELNLNRSVLDVSDDDFFDEVDAEDQTEPAGLTVPQVRPNNSVWPFVGFGSGWSVGNRPTSLTCLLTRSQIYEGTAQKVCGINFKDLDTRS